MLKLRNTPVEKVSRFGRHYRNKNTDC